MDYWERVRPTYIENWPSELTSLSITQVDVPLTVDEAVDLGMNQIELFETWLAEPVDRDKLPDLPDIYPIRQRIGKAVAKFPSGAFVRLGSRSPKDSWGWYENGPKVLSAEAALDLLLGTSERINDDLHMMVAHDYEPHIWVRQWQDIEPYEEFRCFARGGEIVGISQYDHLGRVHYPWIEENEGTLIFAIESFFDAFRQHCHVDPVIFDVFVKINGKGNTKRCETTLLEINPYFELTDPCLFDWRDPSMFDGRFLSVRPQP